MRYLPHTPDEIKEMLKTVGAGSLEELFDPVGQECRRDRDLDLPGPLSEFELLRHIEDMVKDTCPSSSLNSFLGAGNYQHYIPAIIPHLVLRSEFYTAYTPYQPEISQGTLQGIFEYQTLVCKLLGMEVSNASMYDGATALAEALFMALRVKRKKKTVAVSLAVHPHYRQVVDTYFETRDARVVYLPYDRDTGRTDLSSLEDKEDLAAIAIQSPNFFGCIEDMQECSRICKEKDALFVASFTEPLAFGLLKPPGDFGADICCGEGQSLGISQSFGGPSLGIFTSKLKYVRSMPGRLVGMTKDREGKRGFVLTLSTREQHIRREKATSNICSNQGLCALIASMYLATMGEKGIAEVAKLCFNNAVYLKNALEKAGYSPIFSSSFFNEFVVDFKGRGKDVYDRLKEKGIILGLPMERYYPELGDSYLVCVTETKTKEDMDVLIKEVLSC